MQTVQRSWESRVNRIQLQNATKIEHQNYFCNHESTSRTPVNSMRSIYRLKCRSLMPLSVLGFVALFVFGCDSPRQTDAKDQTISVQVQNETKQASETTTVSPIPYTREQSTSSATKDDQQDPINVAESEGQEPPLIGGDRDWVKEPTIEIEERWIHMFPNRELWIDPEAKQVLVGGEICMNAGPLEMFICPGNSKAHESIMGANALSSEVHAALLAVGATPGKPCQWKDGYVPAFGSTIEIDMIFKDEQGKTQKVSCKEWIVNSKTQENIQADFVFGGSFEHEGYYTGDGGELVCLSNFTTATIDINVSSTKENENLLFFADESNVPSQGTHVYAQLSYGKMIENADPNSEPLEQTEPSNP